jgi:hypothetical protein
MAERRWSIGFFLYFWFSSAFLTHSTAGEKALYAAGKIIPSQSFVSSEQSITGSCNFGFDPVRNGA